MKGKYRVWIAIALTEAVAIILLLVYLSAAPQADTQPPEDAAQPAPESERTGESADVIRHPPQQEPSVPLVVEAPLLDGDDLSYDAAATDMATMLDYLEQRLAGMDVVLSPSAMERICEELGNESWVYYCGYTWVQYGDFGILVLLRPTAVGKADTCYVFENNRYKGFLDPQGGVNLEDCIIQYGDDIWLKTYRYGSGSGFGEENRFWYRLTSRGLHCELQYTSYQAYSPLSNYYTYYHEDITGIELSEYGETFITTSSSFTLQDGWDSYTYQFQHEADHTYRLHLFPQSQYQPEELRERILIDNQQEIIALLREGTPQQKESLHTLIQHWISEEEMEKNTRTTQVYQAYLDWYNDYQPFL